jgi:imidazolonepropionase-like amidohydrolase
MRFWSRDVGFAPILTSLAALVTSMATPLQASDLYVATGKLIDVQAGTVRTNQCISITNDRITAVTPCGATPKGAKRLDWTAFTVLPGMIDLHTHLADAGQSADLALPIKTSPAATALIGAHNAQLTLEAGFTTVRDVGTYRGLTDIALRDAINAGLVPGPRMFVAGAYITLPKGGGELNGVVPNEELPADMRLGIASTPEEAAAKTAFLIEQGADFIKTIATGAVLAIGTEPGEPELSEAQLRAVVQTAKAKGKFVTAHAHGAIGIKTQSARASVPSNMRA